MRWIGDRWGHGSEEERSSGSGERRREDERASRGRERGESGLDRERWESGTSQRSSRDSERSGVGSPGDLGRNRRYGVASSQGYGGAVEREGYGGFGSEGGSGRGSYGYTREAYGFGAGGRGTGSESSSGPGRGREWDRSGIEWAGVERGSGDSRSTSSAAPRIGSRGKRSPKGYTRSDERIREDVCDRLTESYLECEEVTVTVKNGEVVLTGRAPSGETRRQIERIAEAVTGVQEVTNQIRTRRDEDGQDGSESRRKQKGRSSSSSSSTRKQRKWTVDPTVGREGS